MVKAEREREKSEGSGMGGAPALSRGTPEVLKEEWRKWYLSGKEGD